MTETADKPVSERRLPDLLDGPAPLGDPAADGDGWTRRPPQAYRADLYAWAASTGWALLAALPLLAAASIASVVVDARAAGRDVTVTVNPYAVLRLAGEPWGRWVLAACASAALLAAARHGLRLAGLRAQRDRAAYRIDGPHLLVASAGVSARHVAAVPLGRITDVVLSSSVWQRRLGIRTVSVATLAGNHHVVTVALPGDADRLRADLVAMSSARPLQP